MRVNVAQHVDLVGWRGRARTSNDRIQSPAFCQLNYPPLSFAVNCDNPSEILKVSLKAINTKPQH